MIKLSVSELIKATAGQLISGSDKEVVKGVSIDSRSIKKDELFIALKGENCSGEAYIEEALKKGACGYLKQRAPLSLNSTRNQCRQTKARSKRFKEDKAGVKDYELQHGGKLLNQSSWDSSKKIAIEVGDSLKALQNIAHYVLNRVRPKVVAITGSTGKTSVKDMLASILSLKFRVIASKENYNNEIGLPLTLLELNTDTEVVILEMAMRGPGQISELCSIASPNFAVITNTGKSHIGLLKSLESIKKTKAEIIDGLEKNGVLFLNGDDKASKGLALKAKVVAKKVVFFGSKKMYQVSYGDVHCDELARPTFILENKIKNFKRQIKITLPVAGIHQVLNASCAASVALEFGVSLSTIKKGLKAVKLSADRMKISKVNGSLIINDSYNASPASVMAALSVLKRIKAKRKVAVLGDMLELGNLAIQEHEKIGLKVVKEKIDELITVGELAKNIARMALKAGMKENQVKSFENGSKLKSKITSYLKEGDAILIKASRALKLDEIVHYLQKKR